MRSLSALLAAAASAAFTATLIEIVLEKLWSQPQLFLAVMLAILIFDFTVCFLSALFIALPIWLVIGRLNAQGPRSAMLLGAVIGATVASLLSWGAVAADPWSITADRADLSIGVLVGLAKRGVAGLVGGCVGGFVAYSLSGNARRQAGGS